MFRALASQNLTSFNKRLSSIVRGWMRKYSNGCPCPQKPHLKHDSLHVHGQPPKFKVTICGARGQVGSIIAFLLKQSPLVDILALYDLDCTYGMAMDLSHIDTKCKVQSFSGCDDMHLSMCESQIIIICAGVGRVAGMSLNDLFEYNAPVVEQLAEAITKVNPEALVAVLTNPINSFVPMVSRIFKNARCYDSRKIFGITTIDTMRACTIVTNDVLLGTEDPAEFIVPVIGGHSPETMVPILSQTSPCVEIPNVAFDCIIDKIRNASNMVTLMKQRSGPRLSVALGATRFINNLIRGLRNEKDVVDLAFVYTNYVPGVCYFASPIELGPAGIKQNLGLLKIDETLEKQYFDQAIQYLKCDIRRGEDYIIPPPNPCA